MDSDDYIDVGMYKRLLDNAVSNDADIAECNHYLVFSDGYCEKNNTGEDCLFEVIPGSATSRKELFLKTYLNGSVVTKLYKRSFLEEFQLQFAEDMPIAVTKDVGHGHDAKAVVIGTDIELQMDNGEYILAQAKAVEHSSTDFRYVRKKLKEALVTLSEGYQKAGNTRSLILITNSPNPLNEKASKSLFYGHAHRSFSSLPESSQKIIFPAGISVISG